MNEFKVAGYKIGIQKSVVFLYVNNSEIFKIISLNCSIRIKYLEISLTKEVKTFTVYCKIC